MKPDDDSPSIWDIRRCLLSSLDFAEDFGLSHPQHADAVTHLSQEIRRIKEELISAFEDSLNLSPIHDIVNGLVGARAMAVIMAERNPEKSEALGRFKDSLIRAQKEFIRKVRPQESRQT